MSIRTGKQLTTPGTAVALAAQRTPASWVVIQWPSTATGNMYVGGTAINSPRPLSANAPAISPGNSVTLPAIGVCTPYNLGEIFIDSDNAATAVYMWGRN